MTNVSFDYAREGFYITFSHLFLMSQIKPRTLLLPILIAMKSQSRKSIKLEEKFKYNDEIYFHREILGYSIENRAIELLTISGTNKMTDEKE